MIQTFKTHLTAKQNLTHDVILFHFALDEPKELAFIAGQYMVLLVPDGSGDYLRRLYSIASPPAMKNSFELIAKIVENGIASEYFNRMNAGEEVLFQGPAGRFILRDDQKDKVFLATGTGIAPILSMLKTALPINCSPLALNAQRLKLNYQLLWGIPTCRDVYCFDELKQMATTHSHFAFTICLSRETTLDMVPEPDRQYFTLGRITKLLDEIVKTSQSSSKLVEISSDSTNSNQLQPITTNSDYYICGDRDVVESLRRYLYDQKIPPESVVFEKF